MSNSPIVAGTDGSPRATLAVDRAGDLAEALGAPVHIVCVPSYITAQDWPPRITAQQIAAEAADRLRARGIAVETHLPPGDAAASLVAVADEVQAQMIVLGNKGMTGLRRLTGSIPNRVSHHARCDVLIVPTGSDSLPSFTEGSIVVGTDGTSGAKHAVKRATHLAKALGRELHIVSSANTSAAAEPTLAAAAGDAAEAGIEAQTHAVDVDPVDGILGVAQQRDGAMVVVGSKGMHAGEREWFGNIPDRISHAGVCSVLIVFTDDEDPGESQAMSGVAAASAPASAGEEPSP
jgi:nucleotide-binding universal stress UspA family protein